MREGYKKASSMPADWSKNFQKLQLCQRNELGYVELQTRINVFFKNMKGNVFMGLFAL